MPREPPNCNSLRVQRASRLNHIEEGRLENHVHLMTKEFRRSSRLANQDMRIINLTLEFIQNSSGHSVEGRPPSHREKAKNRKLAPCFMYGERVISRKYRRTQSAVPARRASTATTVSTVSEGDDGEGDEELENIGSSRVRPQSSPMRRLGRPMSGVRRAESAQGLRRISDSLSDLSIQSLESDEEIHELETLVEKHAPVAKQTNGSDSNPKHNHAPNPKPKQTKQGPLSPRPKKRPARSKSAHPASRTTPTFLTQPPSSAGSCSSPVPSRSSSAHPSRPPSSTPSRPASAAPSRASSAATSRSRPSTAYSYGRIQNARILPPEMEILQRVVHLPPTSKIRQEKVMEYKKGLNKNCTQVVDKRFQDFLRSLPQKQAND